MRENRTQDQIDPGSEENTLGDEQEYYRNRQYWDGESETFDDEADHGLRNPVVRSAWTSLLAKWLPHPPAKVLDLGCGTGSLCIVVSSLGHRVTGIDFSPAMISVARSKAKEAGYSISFRVMDALDLDLAPEAFDVILCRHLLWALTDPASVLTQWSSLLAREGCFLLIEGYWNTGGGLHAQEIIDALPPEFNHILIRNLSPYSKLWDREVRDERFLIFAQRQEGKTIVERRDGEGK